VYRVTRRRRFAIAAGPMRQWEWRAGSRKEVKYRKAVRGFKVCCLVVRGPRGPTATLVRRGNRHAMRPVVFPLRFSFSFSGRLNSQGPVGWGFCGCEPHEVLQQMLRRCVERAVVADHERHAGAGKAFNMHRASEDYPKTIRWCPPWAPTNAVFIETCVPKRDARAGVSVRLFGFANSVRLSPAVALCF
jgi:hypothetical protein